MAESFDEVTVVAPRSGEVLARHAGLTRDQFDARLAALRAAQPEWAALDFADRRRVLARWRLEIATGVDELAHLVAAENGKPVDDAVFEIAAAANLIGWAADNAERVLGPRDVDSPPFAAHQRGRIVSHPFGLVAVLGPWNWPVSTPMGIVPFALAAGNAVAFKPSEFTPGPALWLADAFRRAAPEHAVLDVLVGRGDLGAALCEGVVDKVAFTGSVETGRKVAEACARHLTPALLELGGKDAMIVAGDADLDAAVEAAVWGSLQNAGQGCISIERVYVADALFDDFARAVADRAARVRLGEDIGPITTESQLSVIRRHLEDAADKGARFLLGGPACVQPPYVAPVVVTDIPHDALLLTEETFGPVVTLVRVADEDEAIARANAGPYGLGSAVFSASRGHAIAARLRAGMTSIGSAIGFSFVPALPFGGVKHSGWGRKHGDEGLREFAWPQAIAEQVEPPAVPVARFARPPQLAHGIKDMLLHAARRQLED